MSGRRRAKTCRHFYLNCSAFVRLRLKHLEYHSFGQPAEYSEVDNNCVNRFVISSKCFVEKLGSLNRCFKCSSGTPVLAVANISSETNSNQQNYTVEFNARFSNKVLSCFIFEFYLIPLCYFNSIRFIVLLVLYKLSVRITSFESFEFLSN